MGNIEYHLKGLEIAYNKNDERHILPNILDSDKLILDIGCGIGQSLLGLDCTNRICFGIDIDEDAIRYGIENYGNKIHFILSDAKHIPLPSNTFDLVYSRVAVPYMNIPKVIKEITRVLRKGGRIWMTFHSKEMAKKYLQEAIQSKNIKRIVYTLYILLNGYFLKYFGMTLPYITGYYESWQDITTMKKMLIQNNFDVQILENGKHNVIEGKLLGFNLPKIL